MQNCKINANNQSLSREILIRSIDYLKYKIEHNTLSVSEMQALVRFFCEDLNLEGTAEDFADFFGQSKNNVKVAICRKLIDSPKRKVLYPFSKFIRIVPRTWYDGIESQK